MRPETSSVSSGVVAEKTGGFWVFLHFYTLLTFASLAFGFVRVLLIQNTVFVAVLFIEPR